MGIPDKIEKLPIPLLLKMKIERRYLLIRKTVKKAMHIKEDYTSGYYPMARINRLYGDEYLLKRYSQYNDYIYALIEHGLYFGNNTVKVCESEGGNEWELGCIITYGDYRKALINRVFPEYHCLNIGPMIHYTQTDEALKKEIQNKLNAGKTFLYFPVHGSEKMTPFYDRRKSFIDVIKLAKLRGCNNLIICTYQANIGEMDTFLKLSSDICDDVNTVVTTCGDRFDEKFLDRQRTLIELSDYTGSNDIGTHVGYCIYLNKPHTILDVDFEYKADKEYLEKEFGSKTRSNNYIVDVNKEKKLFKELFSVDRGDEIYRDQYEICNFYWGYEYVRGREELRLLLNECKKKSLKFIKEKTKRHIIL